MANHPRPLKIFQDETHGTSYTTHRYCYDSESAPGSLYDKEQDFIFENFGETDKSKKSRNLQPLAERISKISSPIFSYFLDGSRRVYKLDDIQYAKRIYPILLGQIGASCCQRDKDGNLSNLRTDNRLILAVPTTANPDGGGKSAFFDAIRNKINNESTLTRLNLELHSIITYQNVKDEDYADLAIADLHEEMLDMEKGFVNWLVKKQKLLTPDSMLMKDGSLEYKKISRGTYKDISHLKSNYKCVVGVSKKFNPEKSYDSKGRSNAVEIAKLPLYHRTPAFKFRSNVAGGSGGAVHFVAWYVRIRRIEDTISPFDGVVKVERLLVDENAVENGLPTDEIDTISANIIWERHPTCYGSDPRWANHLYPIHLTERCLKSRRLSDHVIMNLL
ncbi:hypothetical protein [Desulfogranum marinum]|uniref:hypothetical protein n=1 Tax=Desulfogranum marinum TaxID=453220 RepID=UPI001963F248|nr:hypothetical protein [Desulfogranum marinum]MBM9514785.1 hypothetical protein [Desulfogranum marinum]